MTAISNLDADRVEEDALLLPSACKPFRSEHGNDFYSPQETLEYAVAVEETARNAVAVEEYAVVAGSKIFNQIRAIKKCHNVVCDMLSCRNAALCTVLVGSNEGLHLQK